MTQTCAIGQFKHPGIYHMEKTWVPPLFHVKYSDNLGKVHPKQSIVLLRLCQPEGVFTTGIWIIPWSRSQIRSCLWSSVSTSRQNVIWKIEIHYTLRLHFFIAQVKLRHNWLLWSEHFTHTLDWLLWLSTLLIITPWSVLLKMPHWALFHEEFLCANIQL